MFQENSVKRGSGAQERHQIQSSGNTVARSSTVPSRPSSSLLFCFLVCKRFSLKLIQTLLKMLTLFSRRAKLMHFTLVIQIKGLVIRVIADNNPGLQQGCRIPACPSHHIATSHHSCR